MSARLTAAEVGRILQSTVLGNHRSREYVVDVVEQIIAERIGAAGAALREGLADESLEATGVMERALDALSMNPPLVCSCCYRVCGCGGKHIVILGADPARRADVSSPPGVTP